MFNSFKAYSPYIFVISILILLVIPSLVMQGMFMDGLQYACVSRNLFQGIGSFWHPVLSQTWYMNGSNNFMEHPPLFYWMESCVFYLFGDSEYSERIFSMILLSLNAFVLHKIWILVFKDSQEIRQRSWLPIFLWIITPICFWTFQNNMIEMQVSLFSLLCVYFGYKGFVYEKYRFVSLTLAGLCVFLGFLTKGFPALFTLAIGFAYAISFREKEAGKKVLTYSLFLLLITLLLFAIIIFLSNDAKESLNFYIGRRVLSRLETTPTVNYRVTLLYDLFSELIPIFVVSMLVYFFRRNTYSQSEFNKRSFLFFLILGFAGSLPFMLTFVQKKFYFMPAISFFALCFSCLIVNGVNSLLSLMFKNKRMSLIFIAFSCVLFCSSITVVFFSVGKYNRDKDVIEDTQIIGKYLTGNSVVSTDKPTYYSWSFQFYLLRKFNISLDQNISRSNYFVTKRKVNDYFKLRYTRVDLSTRDYHLYIKTLLDN